MQQLDHRVVARRREVDVGLSDGEERGRRIQAHDLVGDANEAPFDAGRPDRDRQHDARRAGRSRDLARRARGGTGGEAVVDNDRRAPLERDPLPSSPIRGRPAVELGLLGSLDGRKAFGIDARGRQHLAVDDEDAVLAERAHGQLGLGGHADLADHDHVEGRTECGRHLEADRHAATGQAEDDHVGRRQVSESLGELPARVGTVPVDHAFGIVTLLTRYAGDMLPRSYDSQRCSIAKTLEIVGDRWTMLVIREAFWGTRRFDDFQRNLGIARTVLTDRLGRLVDEGLLRKQPYQERPARFEYRLTEKGIDLWPVLMALLTWGDRHAIEGPPPVVVLHRDCGGQVDDRRMCARCGAALGPFDVRGRFDDPRRGHAARDRQPEAS